MSFSAAANMALKNIYSRMGEEAVFSPLTGDDVTCNVIIDAASDWEPGGSVQVAEQQIVVNYRRADIDRKVKRGETFTAGSVVYTVVSMAHYPGSWTAYEGKAVVIEA